jgi:hypothetical protein
MTGAFAQAATALLAAGYSPIPVRPGARKPLVRWERLRTVPLTAKEIGSIANRYTNAGLAVAGGFAGLVPIDVDTEDAAIIDAVTDVLPRPVVAKAGSRGFTGYYRDASGTIGGRKFQGRPPERRILVEVLGTGQTLIPPTIHPKTGRPYRWLTSRTLLDTPPGELSVLSRAHLTALGEALRPWLPERQIYVPPSTDRAPTPPHRLHRYAQAVLDAEANALRRIPKDRGRNWQLFTAACKVGKYVHHRVLALGEIESALLGACQANGLIGDDGLQACRATLASGLRKAANDALPLLEERGRAAG